jgi:two-component system, OmpR family, phosphate regulon response regulator PhoB
VAATILIVEDQPSIAELMELHLRAAGYTVAVAEDAIVAGRMILGARPDLLLVDVSLPYMSGHDFVATLLADQTIPHIPVIFITGDQTFGPRAALLGAGVITKPCEAGTLVALVERMLTNMRPVAQATARLEPNEKQAAA